MAETLYIIDGHAQFFRAYYAIRGGLTSRVTGEPTAMVFGYAAMLAKLFRECKPDHVVLVIDAAGDQETFRSDLYPEYKANREEAPDDFGPQVERCLEFTRALGIPVYAEARVEADDVIATLVRRVRREHPAWKIRIASKDKDLGQLLDGATSLYDIQKAAELTAEALFESKGVRPEHVVDMLALMGDAVDNVPGIAGIGPKTAAQLITAHGTLEGVLANLDTLTPKRRESIEKGRETLFLARQLVRLKDDCDVTLSPAESKADLRRADVPAAMELLRLLGFHSLSQQWGELLGVAGAAGAAGATGGAVAAVAPPAAPAAKRAAAPAPEVGGLFGAPLDGAMSSETSEAPPLGRYEPVTTEVALAALVERLRAAAAAGAVIGLDTETTGVQPRRDALCGLAISVEAGSGAYVPVRLPEGAPHLSAATVLDALRVPLEDPAVPKALHNAKFDMQVLRQAGLRLAGIADDTMVLDGVLHPEDRGHGLKEVAEALLGIRMAPIDTLLGSGRSQRTFDQVPLAAATRYAAADPDVTLRLRERLRGEPADPRERALYEQVELPLVEVLADMEFAGIRLDREELARQRHRLGALALELRERILAASPRAFNPDSPRQLGEVLFHGAADLPPGLGLPVLKRTAKRAPSTDSEVLEALADDPGCTSPIPGLILEYRQVTKLVSTYLVALDEAVNPATGRIHASFHQLGAATGRLSSSDPNLQNIPIRTAMGRDIRKAFVAEPGHRLVCADYSQVELRMLAHLSGDPGLTACFQRGDDIHRAVAAEVFGIDPAAVTEEQRGVAKMVNFGIVYGITPHGLSRRLGTDVPLQRARTIIEDYKARFAGIDRFLQACIEEAQRTGSVRTILGRRRPIAGIDSRNSNQRRLAERVAINTVVQGSAADLIKMAMVSVHRRLAREHPAASLLLQVHDELLIEAPQDDAAGVARLLESCMAGAMSLAVPLVAEASIGSTWAEC